MRPCYRQYAEIEITSAIGPGRSKGHTQGVCSWHAPSTPLSLQRLELHRCRAAAFRAETTNVALRSGRRVLRAVSALDGIPDAFGTNRHGADRDLPIADLDRASRIFEERAIPAARLERPRSAEHPAIENDRPDADETMLRARAGPNAKNLAGVNCRDDRTRKFALHQLPRRDLQVREVAAGHVAHPQADESFPARTQLVDDERGLLPVVDEDTHFRTCDDDAHVEPAVRIRYRVHGLLVLSWMLGPQLLPRLRRMRDVLHSTDSPRGVLGLEIEGAE